MKPKVWIPVAFLLIAFVRAPLFAGYAASPTSTTSGTDSGGATSSTLRLEVTSVSNTSNNVTFRVVKKDGTDFTTSGTLSIRLDCGGANCSVVTSSSVSVGTTSKSFSVYMPTYVQGTVVKNFYARYAASTGYWSYAGPIAVSAPSLATPGSTSTTEIGTSSARLNWGSVTAAESYRYQVTSATSFATSGDGSVCSNCIANATTTGLTQVITGLAPGTTYRWRVRAGNATTGQGSNWSSTLTFTTVGPTVTSVIPSSAVLGQATTFTVNGTNLTAGMGFWIHECAGITEVSGGSASSRQFRCTPSFSTGSKAGEVKTAPGGTLLRAFSVTVTALPVVTSVTPVTAALGQATTFTVYGTNLPAGLGFWVHDCAGVAELAGGTSESRMFRCTPGSTTGTKSGEVKTAPGGTLLHAFSVNVIPLPTVTEVKPVNAIFGEPTVFTIFGSGLPAEMGFWVHDCAGVTEVTGGSPTQRKFRCTPGTSTGSKPGEVKTARDGNLLRAFTVNVIPRPTAASVAPLQATLDVPQTFTIDGTGLPAQMGFWVDGCAGVAEVAGGTAARRQFRCTPGGSGGAQQGEVKVASEGTLLKTFSVSVAAPPAVTGVTPATATLGQPATFTVAGSNLPSGMAFWIDGCAGVSELAGGSGSSRQFRCTPGGTAGQKAGEVKTTAGGALLHRFSITVSGGGGYGNVDPWAQAAADFLVQRGIVVDPPDHDLRGTSDIRRAELAAMLYRALGGGLVEADARFADWHGGLLRSAFVDVADPTVWYYRPAAYLGNLTFGDGISVFDRAQGVFRPDGTISRAWAVKAILEAWDIPPLASLQGVTLFTDVPASHPAARYVYQAVEKGIATGTNGTFSPDTAADRQDLFVLLHRLLDATANARSLALPSPAPLAPGDFDDAGAFAPRTLGSRYEQPVLTGVQAPTASITVLRSGPETVGTLQGVYTVTLEAAVSGIDSRTFTDASGTSYQARPFSAWEAASGGLVDETPAGAMPFRRVKWIAPADRSPAGGGALEVPVTLRVGDGLGSEVTVVRTLSFSGSPAADPGLPFLTLDPLPAVREGEVVEVTGTVRDSGDSESPAFGDLEVFLSASRNGGVSWVSLGRAALRAEGRWDALWRVPKTAGPVLLRARAVNVRGNQRELRAETTIAPRLAIQGAVVSLASQPLSGVRVTLSEGGIDLASALTDAQGAFLFTTGGAQGLATGRSYTVTAVTGAQRATASGIVLTSAAPRAERTLTIGIDSTPPVTTASVSSGVYSAPFTVALTCQDDSSGCAAIRYTTDGSAPILASPVYASPIAVSADLALRFFAVDARGNREEPRRRTYTFRPCSFEAVPESATYPRAGGTGAVTVRTGDDCVWRMESAVPWITVATAGDLRGPGSATYTVAPHPGGAPRSGALTVAGRTVAVTQEGTASHALTVVREGAGSGRVVSDPPGIDCGTQCAATLPEDSRVVLTAVAEPGSSFAGWTGGACFGTLPCEVTLGAPTTVRATFTAAAGLQVVTTFPANGDTGVARSSSVRITFNKDIQTGPAWTGIELRATAGGAPVETVRSLDAAKGIVLLTPAVSVSLAESTSYTVTVPAGAVADAAGEPLAAPYTFSFTTVVPGAPKLFIAAYPTKVMEGDETLVSVWFDRIQREERIVFLSSSPSGLLDHPTEVIVAAGESKVDVSVDSLRNYVKENDRPVTLSATSIGLQASRGLTILDDDPQDGQIRYVASGISGDDDGDGRLEAGERVDFLIEVINDGSTAVFNGITLSVQVLDSSDLRTLSSGTCLIGSIQPGRIEGCDVRLLADDDIPAGRYTLRIRGSWASGSGSFTDYKTLEVFNEALPNFRVTTSTSTLTRNPGQTFSRSFVAVHDGDGFSLAMPRIRWLQQKEGGAAEVLEETYAAVRGVLENEQQFIFTIVPPAVPGTYQVWAEINPPGPDRLPETDTADNLSGVITMIVVEPNLPPVLAPVGGKAGVAGALLTFAVTADDPNPADAMTFSLIGAPAGAAIDPVTGVFSWTPTDAQAPADHTVRVVVTDSATPTLADEESVLLRISRRADLAVGLDDGAASAAPGQEIAYTLRVTNGGPSGVAGAAVSASFPAALEGLSWSCTASAGGSCGAGGTGSLADTADLPAGAVATYTVAGRVYAGAVGSLSVSASVVPPAGVIDPVLGNNSASDLDALAPVADLDVQLGNERTSVTPGEGVAYALTVRNHGPSAASGASVNATWPAALGSVSWTCSASAGAVCPGSGSGTALAAAVSLPAGGALTWTLTGSVAAGATGELRVAAAVALPAGTTDPDSGDNAALDLDPLAPRAALSLGKTALAASVPPGGRLAYLLEVTNGGPSLARGVELVDPLPVGTVLAGVTGDGWSCSHADGVVACSRPELASGVAPPVTLTLDVPAAGGTLINQASVAAVTADADLTDNSATAVAQVACQYELAPAVALFPVSGGEGSLEVLTQTGCAWSAHSEEAWIIPVGSAFGTGHGAISFQIEANPGLALRTGSLVVADQTLTVRQAGLADTGQLLDYYTVAPCRLVDTRPDAPLISGEPRILTMVGSCGVPASARAISVNVTAIGATGSGNIKLWPGDLPQPVTSSINFATDIARANNAIVSLATDGSGEVAAVSSVAGGGTVHLVIDVNGYFE